MQRVGKNLLPSCKGLVCDIITREEKNLYITAPCPEILYKTLKDTCVNFLHLPVPQRDTTHALCRQKSCLQ